MYRDATAAAARLDGGFATMDKHTHTRMLLFFFSFLNFIAHTHTYTHKLTVHNFTRFQLRNTLLYTHTHTHTHSHTLEAE